MDKSEINVDAITTEGGLHFGNPNAPVKIIEFINFKCPFCKMWWENSSMILDGYEKKGQIERIVKHFDKEKPGLDKGNILHTYLNYSRPEQAREDMDFYFKHVNEWGNLDKEAIARYAEKTRDRLRQDNAREVKDILKETSKANVTVVPTIIIGEHFFDENITTVELKTIIDNKLVKIKAN